VARALFANGTVLDRSAVATEFFTMAITLISITKFFSGETKLIEKAENAVKSGRLRSFTYDGTHGIIKATVQPSMKKGSYSVGVREFTCFSRYYCL